MPGEITQRDTAIRLDLMTEDVPVVGWTLKYAVPAKRYPSINDFAEPFDIRFETPKEVVYELRNLILGARFVPMYVPRGFLQGLGTLTDVINVYGNEREKYGTDKVLAVVNDTLGIDIAMAIRFAVRRMEAPDAG